MNSFKIAKSQTILIIEAGKVTLCLSIIDVKYIVMTVQSGMINSNLNSINAEFFLNNEQQFIVEQMTMLYSLAISPHQHLRSRSIKVPSPCPSPNPSLQIHQTPTTQPIHTENLIATKTFKIRTYSNRHSTRSTHQRGVLSSRNRPPPVPIKTKAKESPFQSIELKKCQEEKEVLMSTVDLNCLSPLADKPSIWTNPCREVSLDRSTVVIIAVDALRAQSKKWNKARNQYHSEKNLDTGYSTQMFTLLNSLCGSNVKQSFLGNCRLYFKVRGSWEMNQLRQYLSDHQLTQFDGIIDVRPTHCRQVNLYSLRGVASVSDAVILIEDPQVLKRELPVFKGQEVTVLAPCLKMTNRHQAAVKVIKCLKEMQVSRGMGTQIKGVDKENSNPNQSPNRPTLSPMKHTSTLLSTSHLAYQNIELPKSLLMCQVKQHLESKPLRQQSRERRVQSGNPKERETNRGRPRSVDKWSQPTHPERLPCDASYKQKMVQYVKILESERLSKQKSKGRPKTPEDEQINELEEMTTCLTNRLKSKTPYQLVGDLIRCNAHIVRQVGRYFNYIQPMTHLLPQKAQKESKQSDDTGKWSIPCYVCL